MSYYFYKIEKFNSSFTEIHNSVSLFNMNIFIKKNQEIHTQTLIKKITCVHHCTLVDLIPIFFVSMYFSRIHFCFEKISSCLRELTKDCAKRG